MWSGRVRPDLRITARVPMVYKSPRPGVSTDGSFCATTITSLSSVDSADSTAATDALRPTPSGIRSPGNNTEFFNANNGNVRIFSSSIFISLIL